MRYVTPSMSCLATNKTAKQNEQSQAPVIPQAKEGAKPEEALIYCSIFNKGGRGPNQ